ncbi:MAG: hypothetical protein WC243_00300 [Patescibacteria group bacterium]|jgi:hypothetical protein
MDTFFSVFSLFLRPVSAQFSSSPDEYPPDLVDVLDVIVKVFNVLVFSAGVALAVLILLAAYKFAMAQGDPKGVEGAKKTLTYAVLGFIVVIGVYGLLSLIVSTIGADAGSGNPASLISNIRTQIIQFLRILDITYEPFDDPIPYGNDGS